MTARRPGHGLPLTGGGLSRRSLLSAIGLGAAGLTLSACGDKPLGVEAPPEGAPLVIGTCLELSGYSYRVGKAQWNAINIIADTINRSGFIAGGRTRNSDVSAIIGGGAAATSLVMAGIAEQHQIPMISLSSARTITLPAASRQYVFRLGPNSGDVADLLTKAITSDPTIRTVLIVPTADPHGDDGAQAMLTRLNAANLQASVVTNRPPAQPVVSGDLKDTFDEALTAGADAVVIWAVAPASGVIARALRDVNRPIVVKSKMFFDAGASSAETTFPQNTQAVKGSVSVATALVGGPPSAVTTPAAAARAEFFNTYTSQYERFDGLAPYGGDALRLIVDAVAQSGESGRQALREALEQTNSFEGLAGTYTFGPGHHGGVTASALRLFDITEAGWVASSAA
jgi:branched-chain amino acid transport system substrate-binding protein